VQAVTAVDCNGCKACCYSLIILQPSDNPANYATEQLSNGHLALARRPNGECVYLGPKGCSIWPEHPTICKAFDCARHYLTFSRKQRRQMLARKQYDPAIYKAGKERADRQMREAATTKAALEVVANILKRRSEVRATTPKIET
jgi:Fe-S-cluster containining protein